MAANSALNTVALMGYGLDITPFVSCFLAIAFFFSLVLSFSRILSFFRDKEVSDEDNHQR